MPRLYLASNNRHKAAELQQLLGALKPAWTVALARDLDPAIAWDESGDTFLANARIKAEAVRALTKECVLADDSGLVVDALGGLPGVHSSRYAGRDGDDLANNAKLQAATSHLEGSQLTARFMCTLYFIDAAGEGHAFTGSCEGHLTHRPSGKQGFGYDPLFVPSGGSKTMADMDSAEKNAIIHRSKAFAAFAHWLQGL